MEVRLIAGQCTQCSNTVQKGTLCCLDANEDSSLSGLLCEFAFSFPSLRDTDQCEIFC